MSGWVKVHRRLAGHSIWTGERFTRGQAWVDLILRASYTDHVIVQGNRAVTVRRGQVLTSQVALHKRWRWDRETVRAFLRLLKSLGMVAIETSKATDTGYTLVTLLNYELYQCDGHEALAVTSAIESAIQTSIHPPSTRHPPATIKKGKKGEKGEKQESGAKDQDPDLGLLDRPRTPVKSGSEDLAGPPSPGPMKGPWMENMTLVELADLFRAVPSSGFAQLYADLLDRRYKQDLLDEAVKLVIPGWPLEPEEDACRGGRVALSGSGPSGGSPETVGGPSVEDLVAGLLDVADAEERRTVAELLVKWGIPATTVGEALWLAQEITTVDPELDRQAARAIEKHGDAHCQAAITETLHEARAWLSEAREMRAHDPHLWARLQREEAPARNGRGGRA